MAIKKDIVKVTQLNKTFVTKNNIVKAIDNVSFSIKEGETVGLIGESGSGKTTVGRTLLRLYKADSGSVLIDNKEYANKRISKKFRKSLRNNAQMIFQDPYSSLNGQKNILQIVSEPLIVNGSAKKEVKKYLAERKEMLVFFRAALKTSYYQLEWKNEIKMYESNIKAYKKSIKDLKAWKIDTKDVKLMAFNAVVNAYYKPAIEAKNKIISASSKAIQKHLRTWIKFHKDLQKGNLTDWDEVALVKATNKFVDLDAAIAQSKETRNLINKINKKNEDYNSLIERYKLMNDASKTQLKEAVANLEFENKQLKIQIRTSKTYAEQNYFRGIIIKNKIIIDEVNKFNKINGAKIFELESSEINNAISQTSRILKVEFKKLKNLLDKSGERKMKDEELVKFLTPKRMLEPNGPLNKYFESLLIKNAEIKASHKRKLDRRISTMYSLYEKIQSSTINDKKRNKKDLKRNATIAFMEYLKAVKSNKKERKQFAQNYKAKFEREKINHEKKIIKLKESLKEVYDKAQKDYFAKMQLVSKTKCDYLLSESEKTKDRQKLNKFVDEAVSLKKQRLEVLIAEWERLDKSKSVISNLFGINKKPFLRKRLKNLIIKKEVFKTLSYAGLQPSHAFRYPHEFSGGMRQRVGIARAIINKPKFIIADEPIAALDLSIQAQVVNMLLNQKDRLGLAMLFIAHDLSMVRFNSDRILIMHMGKIVEYGKTEAIFKNPKHPYTKNLIKTMPSLKNLSEGFKDSTFMLNYSKNYTTANKPQYIQVGNVDHYILADEKQSNEWLGKNK